MGVGYGAMFDATGAFNNEIRSSSGPLQQVQATRPFDNPRFCHNSPGERPPPASSAGGEALMRGFDEEGVNRLAVAEARQKRCPIRIGSGCGKVSAAGRPGRIRKKMQSLTLVSPSGHCAQQASGRPRMVPRARPPHARSRHPRNHPPALLTGVARWRQ